MKVTQHILRFLRSFALRRSSPWLGGGLEERREVVRRVRGDALSQTLGSNEADTNSCIQPRIFQSRDAGTRLELQIAFEIMNWADVRIAALSDAAGFFSDNRHPN